MIRKVVEAWPNCTDHDLETLAALEALCTKPNASNNSADKDGEERTSCAERSACENGKVDAENATNESVKHGRYAHKKVANNDGENRKTGIESFADRCRRHCLQMSTPSVATVQSRHAPWYIEIEKASATQKPSRLGHVHVLSGDPKGIGSMSLFETFPSSSGFSERSTSRCLSPMLNSSRSDPTLNLRVDFFEKARRLVLQ